MFNNSESNTVSPDNSKLQSYSLEKYFIPNKISICLLRTGVILNKGDKLIFDLDRMVVYNPKSK